MFVITAVQSRSTVFYVILKTVFQQAILESGINVVAGINRVGGIFAQKINQVGGKNREGGIFIIIIVIIIIINYYRSYTRNGMLIKFNKLKLM